MKSRARNENQRRERYENEFAKGSSADGQASRVGPGSRQQRDADVAAVILERHVALEMILDHPRSDDVLKAEAERELLYIQHLHETYFAELMRPGKKTGDRISRELLDLHARLAAALDAQ